MRHGSFAFLAMALAGCQSMPSPEVARVEVGVATQSWAAAFNSCDSVRATALYDSEPVLWGTVAPAIITSSTGVQQYFERVCSSNPKPKVAFGEQHIRVYGDTAVNSGAYTFTVFPGGQPFQFPARYSFTYRKKDGQWLIVDHHSSALPSPPSPPAPARQ
ncbi:MAG: DUF4440 domain-containing protein [Caldimonas sp.]